MNEKFDGLLLIAVSKSRSVSSPSNLRSIWPKKCRVCVKNFVCAQDGRAVYEQKCFYVKKKCNNCCATTLKVRQELREVRWWGHEPEPRGHQESQVRLKRACTMLAPPNPRSICGQDPGWSWWRLRLFRGLGEAPVNRSVLVKGASWANLERIVQVHFQELTRGYRPAIWRNPTQHRISRYKMNENIRDNGFSFFLSSNSMSGDTFYLSIQSCCDSSHFFILLIFSSDTYLSSIIINHLHYPHHQTHHHHHHSTRPCFLRHSSLFFIRTWKAKKEWQTMNQKWIIETKIFHNIAG